jgi:hypothetical protein
MKNISSSEVNMVIESEGRFPVIYKNKYSTSLGHLVKRPNRHNEFSFLFVDEKTGFKCGVSFGNLLDHPNLKTL